MFCFCNGAVVSPHAVGKTIFLCSRLLRKFLLYVGFVHVYRDPDKVLFLFPRPNFMRATSTPLHLWLSGRVVGMLDLRSTGHGFKSQFLRYPSFSAVECNPGQVVNTHVPLSPSSIIWYQPMGGDALRLGR